MPGPERQDKQRFCWVDLASSDETAAREFYSALFGWVVQDRKAGAGRFATFSDEGERFASVYQLSQRQIGQGVPSHWTPYVRVADVDAAAARAADLGGQILVLPHDVEGMARIALICDPTGALVGLWQDREDRQPVAPVHQ